MASLEMGQLWVVQVTTQEAVRLLQLVQLYSQLGLRVGWPAYPSILVAYRRSLAPTLSSFQASATAYIRQTKVLAVSGHRNYSRHDTEGGTTGRTIGYTLDQDLVESPIVFRT